MIVWESHPGPWESSSRPVLLSLARAAGIHNRFTNDGWDFRVRSLGSSTSRPGPPPVVGKKKAAEKIWILASTTEILSCTFCYEIGGHYYASVFHQIAILVVCLERVTITSWEHMNCRLYLFTLEKTVGCSMPCPQSGGGGWDCDGYRAMRLYHESWEPLPGTHRVNSQASGSYEPSKL